MDAVISGVPLVRHRREGGGGEGLLRGADAAEERAHDAQLTESIETNAKYADAVRASKAKAWLEARG